MTSTYDVIVIGGGPSGSTAGNLLAQAGVRVCVLEKERFPRFHIGESLLPSDIAVLERLGMSLDGHPRHLLKRGAEFFDEANGRRSLFTFGAALYGTQAFAYQVERSSFDAELLARAAEVGADVHEGERVVEVDLGEGGVSVRSDRGSYRARYLIDATGLDCFLAMRHRTRRRIDEFGLGAVFRHVSDLRSDIVEEWSGTGVIKVFFVDDGWVWAIPLGSRRLSLGLVSRKRGIKEDWLEEEVARSPELTRILEGARSEGGHTRMGAFSCVNERPHGSRWLCVGDAACFLDPVFSSGVSFGMVSAEHAVDALVPALSAGTEADRGLMDPHVAHMTAGYNVFATLVYVLYQRRLLPDLFFTEDPDTDVRKGLTTILAGEVWRDDNAFQAMLWSSSKRRYELPVALSA